MNRADCNTSVVRVFPDFLGKAGVGLGVEVVKLNVQSGDKETNENWKQRPALTDKSSVEKMAARTLLRHHIQDIQMGKLVDACNAISS